jgi:UDP-N-acetylmuramoylalanine--D-glutamate ligase
VPLRRAAGRGARFQGGELYSDCSGKTRRVLPAARLSLPGAHNVENALAALAAAECLGVAEGSITSALTEFEGLPHRSRLVAESKGVRWYDDSKGTNVGATAKALEAHAPGSVLLILGGGTSTATSLRCACWSRVTPAPC